jgi:PhzF family phenazine biosynthesis protein
MQRIEQTFPLYVVDAFAARPFQGNPAAVCLLDRPREPAWMQSVAAEMNLSETAFVLRESKTWQLRWFTPKIEVDLCGHATLAAAHILWETASLPRGNPAIFETKSGRLTRNDRLPGFHPRRNCPRRSARQPRPAGRTGSHSPSSPIVR